MQRLWLGSLMLAIALCGTAEAQGFLPVGRAAPPRGRAAPPSAPVIPAEQVNAQLDLPWTKLAPNFETIALSMTWSLRDNAGDVAALKPQRDAAQAALAAAQAPAPEIQHRQLFSGVRPGGKARQPAEKEDDPPAVQPEVQSEVPYEVQPEVQSEEPPVAAESQTEQPATQHEAAEPLVPEEASAAATAESPTEELAAPAAGIDEAVIEETVSAAAVADEHLPLEQAPVADDAGSDSADEPAFRLRPDADEQSPTGDNLPTGDNMPTGDSLPATAGLPPDSTDELLASALDSGTLTQETEQLNLLDATGGPGVHERTEEINAALLPSGGLLSIGTAQLAILPLEADRFTRPPTELALPSGPAHMPDFAVPSRLAELSRGSSKKKQVALTFDDGPHPEYTSQLLAVLGHYNVPATFFFVGVQSKRHPEWVQMTHQAGHEIASHTFDHFRLPKLSSAEKLMQIDENQRLFEQLTGVTPRFLRPPGGQVDRETTRLLAERGMVVGLWDVALNDTQPGRTADELLELALKEVRSGSIVLGHDGVQATIEMLPALIEALQSKGYTFVTMSELAAGK